tara:strand:+ start:4967 stop:5119 length:153 start_codon:yes stop_codon:yes gene_type:complete
MIKSFKNINIYIKVCRFFNKKISKKKIFQKKNKKFLKFLKILLKTVKKTA